MVKQRILRILVFGIGIGGMIFLLSRFGGKQVQEERKTLPAQVEKVVEGLRDFPEEKEVKPLKEKVLGTFEKVVPQKPEIEQRVEEKVREIIQLEEVKKEVFCTQVCEEVCKEVCE